MALDRRVYCRVEPAAGGVEIESKDTLQRFAARDADGVAGAMGALGRVGRALAGAGIRSGVRVVTREKVPAEAGLGTGAALSVALAAALSPSAERAEVLRRATAAENALGTLAVESDLHAAVAGGAHVLLAGADKARVAPLPADPARLEECLMLVDPAGSGFEAPVPVADAGVAGDLVAALRAGEYGEVAGILVRLHDERFASAPPEIGRLVQRVRDGGGAAWPCGRLLAVWAVPGTRSEGPKEAVTAALKAAGVRPFAARVDLRGLEIEEAG